MTEHRTRGIQKAGPAGKAAVARPAERRGTPSTGRIVALVLGQGHGFIRPTSDLNVFFHRSDLCEGTSFHDLAVGDRVSFELLNDAISGPRALRVERSPGEPAAFPASRRVPASAEPPSRRAASRSTPRHRGAEPRG